MPDAVSVSKRDLIARVATLELVLADLIHVLWRVDPRAMEKLAGDACHDLEIGDTRIALPIGDHQRERLHNVLATRKRMLKRPTADA